MLIKSRMFKKLNLPQLHEPYKTMTKLKLQLSCYVIKVLNVKKSREANLNVFEIKTTFLFSYILFSVIVFIFQKS